MKERHRRERRSKERHRKGTKEKHRRSDIGEIRHRKEQTKMRPDIRDQTDRKNKREQAMQCMAKTEGETGKSQRDKREVDLPMGAAMGAARAAATKTRTAAKTVFILGDRRRTKNKYVLKKREVVREQK